MTPTTRAVLASLDEIARRCEASGKPVSVCGELAGDPGGALLLVAMGYRQLSMNSYTDRVRWILRQRAFMHAQCHAGKSVTGT